MGYADKTVNALKELVERYGSNVLEHISRYSSGESYVLRLLVLHDSQPIHPSELTACTGVSAARVAAILKNLEKKGLIVRETDRQDRRRVLVHITAEGTELAQREITEMRQILSSAFKKMGRQDSEDFLRLLERFLKTFKEMESQ